MKMPGPLAFALLLLSQLAPVALRAQEETAPTLSIGLGKLVFGKGAIDVELLTEMIASRQELLAKEAVRREILKRLNDESFTLSNFAYNALDLVMYEKNKSVIKNDLLEYAANLALVYGFSELLVQLTLPDRLQSIDEDNPISILANDFQFNTRYAYRYYSIQEETGLLLSVLKPLDRFTLEEMFGTDEAERLATSSVNLAEVIVDMVYEICRNNYTVQRKGFFLQPMSMTEEEYGLNNKYLRLLSDPAIAYSKTGEALKNLKEQFANTIELIFDKYDLIREMKIFSGERSVDLENQYRARMQDLLEDASRYNELIRNDQNARKAKLSSAQDTLTLLETRLEPLLHHKDSLLKLVLTRIDERIKGIKDTMAIDPDDEETRLIDGYRADRSTVDELRSYLDGQWLVDFNSKAGWLRWNWYLYVSKTRKVTTEADSALIDSLERVLGGYEERYYTNQSGLGQENAELAKLTALAIKTQLDSILPPTGQVALSAYERLYANMIYMLDPRGEFHRVDYARFLLDSLQMDVHRLGVALPIVNELRACIQLMSCAIWIEDLTDWNSALSETSFYLSQGHTSGLDPRKFLEFVYRLNQLDRAETYDYLFKTLNDAGNIIGDKGRARAFNVIVNNLKRYSVINTTEERIDVDVEGIITDLYENYAERGGSWIVPHLNIGLNQAVFADPKGFTVGDSTQLYNLSYASEKLGVRFKLINWRRRYATLPGESKNWRRTAKFKSVKDHNRYRTYVAEPLISDLYLAAYGSGLLYNVVNTKTSKDFDAPIGGCSVGLSFFSGFDLSFGVARAFAPGQRSFDDGLLWTFGFDVRLTDYIKQVQERRKARVSEKERLSVARQAGTSAASSPRPLARTR